MVSHNWIPWKQHNNGVRELITMKTAQLWFLATGNHGNNTTVVSKNWLPWRQHNNGVIDNQLLWQPNITTMVLIFV